ncbi:MAG: ScyD/ScyE family protein [Rhodothermales bacterium]|nr:ScyD/ScyE family protein [Rhodothermales bacterium]
MQHATQLFTAVLLALLLAADAGAQSMPYAADLATPIGLEVDEQGWLWVAQVGTGNDDGRISVITPDGQTHLFLDGLGSVPEADGNAGTYHLRLIDGYLYFTHGLGTVTADGYLLRIDPAGFTPGSGPLSTAAIDTVANVGAFALANGFAENNLYDVAAGPEGDLFLADAGANAVFRLDGATGDLSVFATFDPVPNPTPIGPPVIQAVPSSLVFDGDRLYVGTFSGFPFAEGIARVYAVSLDGEVSVFQDGLSLVTDLALDPADGSLLALQMGRFDPASGFIPETGSVVRLGAAVDTLLSGLMLPSGMHLAPDGDLFVASLIGLVLKLPLTAPIAVEPADGAVPARFTLDQNYPNPFNPATTIRYELRQRAHVRLQVFDALGREVATLVDGPRSAGAHESTWRAAGRPSGLYVYRLQAGGHTQHRTMVLAK